MVQIYTKNSKIVRIYTNWKNAIQSMVVTFIALQRPSLSIFENKFPRISKKYFPKTNSHRFLKSLSKKIPLISKKVFPRTIPTDFKKSLSKNKFLQILKKSNDVFLRANSNDFLKEYIFSRTISKKKNISEKKFPWISKKVFPRPNSHAFLKHLAENRGSPPVANYPCKCFNHLLLKN